MWSIEQTTPYIEIIENKHDVPKRTSEINLILSRFKDFILEERGINIEYVEDAASIITYAHFYLIEQRAKLFLDDLANINKIASCIELTTNLVQPIILSNSTNGLRQLNAELSIFAALSFIVGWHSFDFYLSSGIETLNDSIDTFLQERRKILSNYDLEKNFPILFNAQTWELFHLIYQYFRSAAMIR